MLVASSVDALRTRRRDEEGACRFWRSTFIGSDAGVNGPVAAGPAVPADSTAPYPVACLTELDPRSEFAMHFHRANQFQVFVDGDGHIGRRPIRRITVQFAGAYTAYGPVRSGDNGLHFFTLRDAWDPGAKCLPAHKDELRLARCPRRETLAAPIELPAADALADCTVAGRRTLIAPSFDAMGAWVQQLPAGAPAVVPVMANSGGQFWLVLAGTVQLAEGTVLPSHSCLWLGPDDARAEVRAGAGGLLLLSMRLPARTAASSVIAREVHTIPARVLSG